MMAHTEFHRGGAEARRQNKNNFSASAPPRLRGKVSARATLASIALAAVALGGCGATAAARFYTLDSTAAAPDATDAHYTVAVGPVSIPASVDRPQFVVQVAPNRVELDEFNRWAAPLDESIARAVAGDLAVLLGTPDVFAGPVGGRTPAFRVALDVQRFESTPGKNVLIDVVWTVRGAAAKDPSFGHTAARESVSDSTYEALAAAHSRALATVSADIAAAIRQAAAPPKSSSVPGRTGGKKHR